MALVGVEAGVVPLTLDLLFTGLTFGQLTTTKFQCIATTIDVYQLLCQTVCPIILLYYPGDVQDRTSRVGRREQFFTLSWEGAPLREARVEDDHHNLIR